MTLPPALSLFGRLAAPFLVPAKTASAFARSRGRGRPLGRRAQRAFLDGGEHGGKLSTSGSSARTLRAKRAAVWIWLPILCASLAGSPPVDAAAPVVGERDVGAVVGKASAQFGLPEAWLRALIAVESGGDRLAVSPEGAMGLTQLMPGTWAQMRGQLGLGRDVFDPRDNVLAGAAYLRQLQDRFGAVGGFAAYNAGPGRYAEHLAGGRPLPSETLAYVAAIRRRLGWSVTPIKAPTTRSTDWRAAPLFVGPVADREGAQ